MDHLEQQFLNELGTKFCKSADKVRSNLDAVNYKHVALGLIFLKYVSDAFEERQDELLELFKTDSDEDYQAAIIEEFDWGSGWPRPLTSQRLVLVVRKTRDI